MRADSLDLVYISTGCNSKNAASYTQVFADDASTATLAICQTWQVWMRSKLASWTKWLHSYTASTWYNWLIFTRRNDDEQYSTFHCSNNFPDTKCDGQSLLYITFLNYIATSSSLFKTKVGGLVLAIWFSRRPAWPIWHKDDYLVQESTGLEF